MFSRSSLKLARNSYSSVRNYADQAMAFTFASQSKVLYNKADVRQVDVPTFSGSFGILPNHVPTLACLKPGVLTVFENDGSANKYFVTSGMISINEDSSVQILAEEVSDLDDLDVNAARDQLTQANSAVSSATDEEKKAEAMIAQEVAEEVVKAAEGKL